MTDCSAWICRPCRSGNHGECKAQAGGDECQCWRAHQKWNPEISWDAVFDGVYRALTKWDREVRSVRELRSAMGGRGLTIKRGTKRGAMTRFLTDAVIRSVRTWDNPSGRDDS